MTSDEQLAARAALLRNQAFEEPRFVHKHIGFNYRFTNVQAAIGLAQCERIDDKVARKREIAGWYAALLADAADLTLPVEESWARSVFWMYGVVLHESFGPSRDEVMRALAGEGIETRAFFYPMHQQPVFRRMSDRRGPDTTGTYPVSERLGRSGLYLPSGLTLSHEQVRDVVAALQACRVAAFRA